MVLKRSAVALAVAVLAVPDSPHFRVNSKMCEVKNERRTLSGAEARLADS